MDEQKKTTADGLRALADWYEANPEIDVPSVFIHVSGRGDEAAKKLATIAKAMGTYEKNLGEYSLIVKRMFGPAWVFATVSRDDISRKSVTYEYPKSILETLGPEFEAELAK